MDWWRSELTARGALQGQRSLGRRTSPPAVPRVRAAGGLCTPSLGRWRCATSYDDGHCAGAWVANGVRVSSLQGSAPRSVRTFARSTPMNGATVDLLIKGPGRTARKHPDDLREHRMAHARPARAAGTRGSIAQRSQTSRPTRGGLPRSEASSGPHSGVVRRSTRPTHAHLYFPLQAETLATWTRPSLFA